MVCTHPQPDMQLLEWVDLRMRAISITACESGVVLTFPASLTSKIEDLAEREAACCRFLTLTTTAVTDDELTLKVTSSHDDAAPVIAALTGIENL